MANPQSQRQSWSDRALDRIKPQPQAPARPAPPAVNQTAWEQSVGAHKVNTLTVQDVGRIVFNETQSFTNGDNATDTIDAAREKVAHSIMNGDQQLGRHRPATAHPVEPSPTALNNPKTRAA